jgi:hypothetical protein
VFAYPKEFISSEGESLRYFGRTDLALAYFKEALLVSGEESPVFEWHHEDGLQLVAAGFEEWLVERSKYARERFSQEEWQAIVAGPLPFDEHELKIVDARKKFRWRVIGISPSGDLQFEIFNGSDLALPYLTVGIRGPLRDQADVLNGGVWLPVHDIRPGETRVVEKDCYKDLVAPCQVEAFDTPGPRPEDRNRFWEFRTPR